MCTTRTNSAELTGGIVRPALTLLELLVVIGIVGVLVALLIPAIQRGREAARRSQCQNHMRQIAIALHTYQSTHGVYPAGCGGPLLLQPPFGVGRHYSPLVYLLPYLDNPVTFSAVNFMMEAMAPGSDPPQNSTVFKTEIATFLCPSDPWPSAEPGGRNNYRFNHGSRPGVWPNNGAFPPTEWLRPGDFSDGLCFTVGVSERMKGDGNPMVFRIDGDTWITAPLNPNFDANEFSILCGAIPAKVPQHFSDGGASWFHGSFHHTWYNHCRPPNDRIADCTSNPYEATDGLCTARSAHPGGVNVITMDGSVHFMGDSVSLQTWRAIGTRAGGEPVDAAF